VDITVHGTDLNNGMRISGEFILGAMRPIPRHSSRSNAPPQ
jgi:hypothetical protein